MVRFWALNFKLTLTTLSLAAMVGCGGGRGGGTDSDGNAIGLGLSIVKISGDNQGVKKNTDFPLPLVARVQSPDGTPVPNMSVECKQLSTTDLTFLTPTTFTTDITGLISLSVRSPTSYGPTIEIECGVPGTTNATVFTLETTFTVDYVEWVPGNEPPTSYTADHLGSMTSFQARMYDTDGLLIDVDGTTHWLDLSVETAGNPALRGTTRQFFTAGIATFPDISHLKANTITLRATHNRSGEYVEQTITILPKPTLQTIAVLPGQTYNSGYLTLAEAVTGTPTSSTADNSFNVNVRAVDDYYNTTNVNTAVSISTPNDTSDTEPAPGSFTSGSQTFTINPVQAKSGLVVRPSSIYNDVDSSAYTIAAGTPAELLVRLPGQTFNPGQTSLAAAITGAPSTQIAGTSFTAQVLATDSEYNLVNTTPLTALTTSDSADTNPASQNLAAGTRNFTVTNVTSGSSTVTASAAGYNSNISATYTVQNNAASQIIVTTHPSANIIAGNEIAPIFEIKDAYGNTVTTGPDATANVTLTLFNGTGSLTGTITKAAVAGIADFTGLGAAINLIGTKVLTATKANTIGSGGTAAVSVNTNSFNILHAPASQLVWSTQPSNTTMAGNNITAIVQIQDGFGNIITTTDDATADITLSLQSGTGSLLGTLTKTAVNGVATFTATEAVMILITGAKTLRATKSDESGGTGVGSLFADSNSFTITPAAASQVVWATQPTNPTLAGSNILALIEIRDSIGNVVTTTDDATADITLSLVSGTGTLLGTITKAAVNGIVSFNATEAVNIQVVGAKTLRATKSDESGGTGVGTLFTDSNSFTITPAAASQLVWTTQVTNPTLAGANILPVIEIRDSLGNIVTTTDDATANITLSLQSGTGSLLGTITKAAVNGVVTFTATEALNIQTTGAKILRATKSDESGGTGVGTLFADSSSFTINPTPATTLAFSTQPANPSLAGANLLPVIEIRDTYGNIVTTTDDATADITLSLQSGTGSLLGTVTKTAVAGVVTFTATEAVSIQATGAKTLRATKSDESGGTGVGTLFVDSSSFTVNAAAATTLAYTTQPTNPTLAGANILPVIEIRDTYGNVVNSTDDATADITLSLQSGTGSLLGTITKAAVNGVVTFTATEAVRIQTTGAKILRASKSDESGGSGVGTLFVDSSSFTINPTPATTLAFSTQPANPSLAGANLLPVIEIRDTYGNIVTTTDDATADITLSLQSGTGSLLGTLSKTAVAGVVTFTATEAVSIQATGAKTLRATKSDESGGTGVGTLFVDSSSFTVNAAAATTLAYTTQPTNPTLAGANILPVIEIRDTYGNVVNSTDDATADITLSLQSGTGSLIGTVTKAAVAGVVTFTATEAVNIQTTGAKTLRATKSDESGGTGVGTLFVDSSSFTINAAAATTLAYTTEPANPSLAGANILPAIEIRDTYGNVVNSTDDATADITLFLQSGTGSLLGTLTKTAVAGVVTFTATEAVNIQTTGAKTLRATKSDESGGTGVGTLFVDSSSFTINAAAATTLAYTTQPTNPTAAGANLLPVIEIRDTYGNVVTTTDDATADITLSLQSGTGSLLGTLSKTAVAGVVTFTATEAVRIQTTGTKTLRAIKSDQSAGTGVGTLFIDSSSFSIDHGAATQIVFSTQPTDSAAGADLLPVVQIRDSFGNIVDSGAESTLTVTLTRIAGPAGTLNGTTALAAVNGIAAWTATQSLDFSLAGNSYQLQANTSSPALSATSNAFNITNAAATQLVYTTQPANSNPAQNLLPVIEVRDAFNNIVTTGAQATASVALSLQSGTGSLLGTISKNASAGIVSFTASEAVNIEVCGSKTLRATLAAITTDSTSFSIACPAAPNSLSLIDPGTTPANDPTLELQVGGLTSGYTIALYSNSSTCANAAIASNTASGPTLNFTTGALTDGTYNFYATQTDTYGNVSTCSTATLQYVLDLTNPSPATALTLASSYAATATDSPLFGWTASVSGDVANYQVALGTSSGGTNIVSYTAPDTTTSHTFTGLGLTECSAGNPVYYPSVKAIDNVGNESTVATHPTGFRYDITDPGAPGTPSVSNDANNTQGPTATWTVGSDNCAITGYQMAIGTSAGGVDKMPYTTIGNVLSYQPINGIDGLSLSFSAGVFYYTSIRTIDGNGRVSSVVTSPAWRYVIPPDAITNLAFSSRTSSSIEVAWTAPANNGTPITDYIVEYRLSPAGTWTTFDDGVSSDTTANVTGLTANTAYDLRVKAFNGGTASNSNVVTIETAINDPFFAPDTFTAFNLGDAQTAAVVAFEDDTPITINSVLQTTLNAGGIYNFNTSTGDIVESTKPIYVSGRNAIGSGNTQKGSVVFNAPDWAGKDFLMNGSRNAPHILTIYAFEAGTVNIVGTGGVNITQAVTAGNDYVFSLNTNVGSWNITSDALITAFQYSSGGSSIVDGMPILPPAFDIIGVPSNAGQLTSTGTNVSTNYWRSDNNNTLSTTLNNGALTTISGSGTQYSGASVRVIAPQTITGRSNADGDGNFSAPFLPTAMMRKRYAVNALSEWVAFASDKPAFVRIFYSNGTTGTTTLTKTSTNANAPYKAYLTNIAAGTIFESDERFAAWYEPDQDVYTSIEDESLLFGNDGKGLPVSYKLKMWLDSADSTTLFTNDNCTGVVSFNGQGVGCWKDKSYHGNDATQSSANKPLWNANVGNLGGRGAIAFNGGTNYLNFSQSIVDNKDYTIIGVVVRDNTAADNYVLGTQSGVAARSLHMGFSTNTEMRGAHDSTNALNLTIEGQANNAVGIMWQRLNSTGKKIYFNAKTATDATATRLSGPGQGVIGRGNSTSGLTGKVAEVIVYDRALSDYEINLLETYLRNKWLNPNQINNMRLWLDANETNSLFTNAGCSTPVTTAGANVGCWADKSGSGYQAVTSGGIPVWNADGGRNAVLFSNDNLRIAAGSVGAIVDVGQTLSDFTAITLARSTSSTESGYLFYHGSGSSINASIPFGSNTARMQINGSGNGELSGAWGANTTQPYIWGFQNDVTGGAQYIYRDGNSVATDATTGSVVMGLQDFYIGSSNTPANYQNANIHELFLFRKTLTDEERGMIRAYLMNKWDL